MKQFKIENLLWSCESQTKPVSLNTSKVMVKDTYFISSKKLRNFKKIFGNEIMAFGFFTEKCQRPITNFALQIKFNSENFSKLGDLGNFEKHITDVLVDCRVIEGDSVKNLKAISLLIEKLPKKTTFEVQIFKMGECL